MLRRLPLIFTPQSEGGFTVTSPLLPELVTEGDTLEQACGNVSDALAAVFELYAEQRRPLPDMINIPASGQIVWAETLVEVKRSTATSRGDYSSWVVRSFHGQAAALTASGTILPPRDQRLFQIGVAAISRLALSALVRQLGLDWQTFEGR
jgi:antitoxin HicB